ncbi:MAG: 2,3-bisphosphoglycerate-independent phosphoglycerate mutase [Lachnospiraceae bacterium]|nr:2,3-bisphosphoglycerate-independent phosphoglycerate mutase [Lachnospiraceae bacterium]
MRKKPTILMIIDGLGAGNDKDANKLLADHMPTLTQLKKEYPYTRCLSSGMAVGLPNGQMGNSEAGYMNIGAGRIVYQELTRINKEIQDGTFFTNKVLLDALDYCVHKDSNLHIFGLLSDGGVHSHISHLFAILELAKKRDINRVFIHCFLDGRDCANNTGLDYIHMLQARMRELSIGEIASVHGRYYAMDRDGNYDRLKLSYAALTEGEGMKAANAEDAVRMAYERKESDEFIKPTVIVNGGVPVCTIDDDDSVIFYNFRADRARELTHAFCDDDFRSFKRSKKPEVLFTCFSDYDPRIENKQVVFEKIPLTNTFGEFLLSSGLRFLRLAESEKRVQMTYCFNGGTEEINSAEEKTVIKSSKVPTYDLRPQMCAEELTTGLIKAVNTDRYDVILIEYANLDMLGHTANEEALILAAETVDQCLKRVVAKVMEKDGVLFICSDHGNAEKIKDELTGLPYKCHTTNPVPFVMVNYDPAYSLREGGCLADIVPTVIESMEIEKPREMTGKSLLMPRSNKGSGTD